MTEATYIKPGSDGKPFLMVKTSDGMKEIIVKKDTDIEGEIVKIEIEKDEKK